MTGSCPGSRLCGMAICGARFCPMPGASRALTLATFCGNSGAPSRPQTHRAATGTPVVVSMDTIKATPVTWLWWPYIALGKLTMLDGDPGIGKSLLMTQVAASLSQGHPLPDQDGIPTLAPVGPHDGHALDRRRPGGYPEATARRGGSDSRKIKVLTGWVDANGEHVFTFAHMPVLERTLQEYQPRW